MLFERQKKDGSFDYTYSTAGTEDMIKNGSVDAKQLLGQSQQYRVSAANAKSITNQLSDSELSFTGHSLSRGMVAVNSKLTGKYAATFNAAGVSPHTINSLGANYCSGNIDAFIMKNDPLNMVQNLKVISLPSVNGNRKIINPRSTSGGHSIGNMLEELGGNSVPLDRPNNSYIGNFTNYIRNATLILN